MKGEQVAAALATPGAGLKAILCETVVEVCSAWHRDRLRAIVLTGSVARDEASFLGDLSSCTLLGDAELLLVFERSPGLPAPAEIRLLQTAVEEALLRQNIHAQIGLSAVGPQYFRALKPAIFSYELRTCGQVVWGDTGILSLVPPFSAGDIPLEDAWRLLCNRLVELLEDNSSPEPAVSYRSVKLWLDMATSFLVFAGGYAPSYGERSRALEALTARESRAEEWPFPLTEFSAAVAACTAYKLAPSEDTLAPARGFLNSAVSFAERLWRWQLIRLTGADGEFANPELVRRWMRRQPLRARLRGWAYVLRKCGWHRSWRQWPRWARLALRASPRYWIYAAAAELLAKFPSHMRVAAAGAAPETEWARLREWLPVKRPRMGNQSLSCKELAAEIVWNYKRFLTETRA